MRELWARNIAFLTGVLVIVLAMIFAIRQNPPESPATMVEETVSSSLPVVTLSKADKEKQALIAAGRGIFEMLKCMSCHSIADKGNPRYPLDRVGERRTAEEIRQWIIAPTELKDQLSDWVFKTKQTYGNQPSEDIDTLVIYLQNLEK